MRPSVRRACDRLNGRASAEPAVPLSEPHGRQGEQPEGADDEHGAGGREQRERDACIASTVAALRRGQGTSDRPRSFLT